MNLEIQTGYPEKITKHIDYAGGITIESGVIARQADASVVVRNGETVILTTLVYSKKEVAEQDFFPLSVHCILPAYAISRIPGGYYKREGKPSEAEIIWSRFLDRIVRALFPDWFKREIQILVNILSVDTERDILVPAIASVASVIAACNLPIKDIPGLAIIGSIEDKFVVNPLVEDMDNSSIDLAVAGTKDKILMIECRADEFSETKIHQAIKQAHTAMQVLIDGVVEFANSVLSIKKEKFEFKQEDQKDQKMFEEALFNLIHNKITDRIEEIYLDKNTSKQDLIDLLTEEIILEHCVNDADLAKLIKDLVEDLQVKKIRKLILAGAKRTDGRRSDDIRDITAEIDYLPRSHGSSVFTRGLRGYRGTQVISSVTLGTTKDAQIIDTLSGPTADTFMLHYDFPGYSVNEISQIGSVKRREIGHGKLAWKALQAVLPGSEFPYTIRVAAKVTESNGSSSMATVCSASLSLMSAGVPILRHVAGIAMGLILADNNYIILSDISEDEDHTGYMDFKIAGTELGITAMQLDLKLPGVELDILQSAMEQAKDGRKLILEKMNKIIDKPNCSMSKYAPRITTIKVNPDKIKDIIGKGGSVVKQITEDTGALIDIDQDGVVKVSGPDQESCEIAIQKINAITEEVEIGKIYTGKVIKILDFGAFVNILPGKDGLLHISQISAERIENVAEHVQEGQMIKVQVVDIDRNGKIKLSIRNIEQ